MPYGMCEHLVFYGDGQFWMRFSTARENFLVEFVVITMVTLTH